MTWSNDQNSKFFKQGCSILPTLFNICIDDLARKWKHGVNPGMKLSRDRYLNVLLFADDLLVFQNTESDLQKNLFSIFIRFANNII